MLCRLVLNHVANSVASLGCFVSLNTTVVDPPQLPLTYWPSCHCGIGATRHFPAVCGAFGLIVPAPQAAEIQVAIDPFARSWYQASAKSCSVLSRPLLSKLCQ